MYLHSLFLSLVLLRYRQAEREREREREKGSNRRSQNFGGNFHFHKFLLSFAKRIKTKELAN